MSKISVVILQNHNTYDCKEFINETEAIQHFKDLIISHMKILNKCDYYISKDVFAGLIKITFSDDSDKIMSFLICGLSSDDYKHELEELKQFIMIMI